LLASHARQLLLFLSKPMSISVMTMHEAVSTFLGQNPCMLSLSHVKCSYSSKSARTFVRIDVTYITCFRLATCFRLVPGHLTNHLTQEVNV